MTDIFYSTEGLQNRKLEFVKDANGVYHLVYGELSLKWLSKNKGVTNPQLRRFNLSDKRIGFIEIYDCTGLGLTGQETNNLVPSDWA